MITQGSNQSLQPSASRCYSGAERKRYFSIFDSFGYVEEVPFPSLAVVRRKGLTPDRAVLVPGVPAVDDEDRFPIQGVLAKEMADAVFIEGTNDWRVDRPRVARDPVKTPESRFGVEQPQGK